MLGAAYPNASIKERYRRYFEAFFDVRGDTVRRRVLPRPTLDKCIDLSPEKPGGLSSRVIIEFCQLVGYPVHVLHKDRKIYQWLPDRDMSPAQIEASPGVMFNVHGEHAFFYEREAGRAITQMKVVEPKRVPPFRLAQHPSDTSQHRQPLF